MSGPGSRKKLGDSSFLNELRLEPSRQMIAGIDSGVLLLAKLGLLEGLSATTYPGVFPELEAMGIREPESHHCRDVRSELGRYVMSCHAKNLSTG